MKKIKNKTCANQQPPSRKAGAGFFLVFFLLLFAEGWGGASCFSQCGSPPSPSLTFINPSFEGPSCAGCQPSPWVNCGGTPDTQPGSWGFTQPASNGSSYVSFLLAGSSPGGYYEGSSQALSSCMTAGQVYSFSIDLAHSNVYNTAGPGDCYSSLEILGSNGLCAESEVLWQSGLITSTSWQTYNVTLTPTSNWCYVTFRPYWISSCTGYVNIMMDNLGPLQSGSPAVNATVSADISCSQSITGTNKCPADSIVLTGSFSGSTVDATILTDSTWQANVTYPLGSASLQTINIEVFLTSGGSLYDSITFNLVDVRPAFSATSVCVGNITTFTDSSTTSSGSITGWTWNFGDGSPIQTIQNPTHTYTSSGFYRASLMINSSTGCIDTVSKLVQVYYKPMANFTQNNICFGDSMHFNNTSSVDPSTSITNYLWSFGDSSPTSNLQNPNHYYSTAGIDTVTLIVTTIDGCSNATSKPVNTFDAPTSAFTFSSVCSGDSAKFTNTSLNPTVGSIASWSWNFGDGSPLNNIIWSPTHQYSGPGNYQLTLITYSSNPGCPDTLQDTITVFPMPFANFGFTDVCLNQAINFNDSSTLSIGSISGRSWNFGDSSPLVTNLNPSHTYASPGTYAVSLIVTSNSGCKDTIIKNVVVHPLPTAQFSTANVCLGSITSFADISTIPVNPGNDTIASWRWNFGDGSTFNNNQNTSHLYSAAGSYTVQLLVVSSFGCPDSIIMTSIVNPNPIVKFSASDTSGCAPLCVNFQNLSTIATGLNATWLWSFGDGSQTGSSQNPGHCYTNSSVDLSKFFNVTLTVASENGCIDTLTKNNYIAVYPNPNASFAVQPLATTIANPVISITDFSTGAGFWNWNFGDTTTSSAQNPLPHTYADTGSFLITLIVSTQYNCFDTTSQTVIIEPDFLFYIPNAFTPNGDGINDYFTCKGNFIKEFEMTIFDRWGNLIFFSDDINKPWDGRANQGSDIAQQDVYVYVVDVTDYKRVKHNYKGIISLIK